jgi:uncharacterized membrane protein YphA (DoxX/SURF4 family)
MSGSQLFTYMARMTFGVWLLFVGLSKWFNGYENFIGWISSDFASVTWMPAILITLTSWLILIAEPLCGLWLLIGKSQRCAWLSAGMLMFMLMFGQTLLMKYDTVANNWQYVILCLACAAMSSNSSCCGEKKSCCDSK